jgi:glycosyltransferase involved in cell wall biosynthesis
MQSPNAEDYMALVSVVIPVFNGESHILESVNSILAQSLQDIEVIIIDDGSTDQTAAIIHSLNDARIIYRKLPRNQGTAVATNVGYDLAKGHYIAHMDADDIAAPNRLERQVAFLERSPQIHILGGWMEVFGATSSIAKAPILDSEIKAQFLLGICNIFNPTAMFRHSFMQSVSLRCDPRLRSIFDWGLWVQAMLRGANFANIEGVILRYRSHEKQQSADLSRYRDELSSVRLLVLELFYPNLNSMERVTVEPLLQWVNPPGIPAKQVADGLRILDKMLLFSEQSRVGENRRLLQEIVQPCKDRWISALGRARPEKHLI